MYIGHKLHFYGYLSFAFAGLTASPLGIEREVFGGIATHLGKFLRGKELANIIVSLDVGYRIGSGGLSYGVLVDKLYTLDMGKLPVHTAVLAYLVCRLVELAQKGRVEDILY